MNQVKHYVYNYITLQIYSMLVVNTRYLIFHCCLCGLSSIFFPLILMYWWKCNEKGELKIIQVKVRLKWRFQEKEKINCMVERCGRMLLDMKYKK